MDLNESGMKSLRTVFQNPRWRRTIFIRALFVFAILMICYRDHVMTLNAGIDTANWISGDYGKSWIINQLGRFAYYWSVIVFNARWFSPYMNGIMFMLLFGLSCLAWMFLLDMLRGFQSSWIGQVLFALIYLTHPIWAAQIYFSVQITAIAFAQLCLALAMILLFDAMGGYLSGSGKGIRLLKILVSIVLTVWAFGTYQSYPGVALTAAAACLLLILDREDVSLGKFWLQAGGAVAHFLASYGIYQFILHVNHWGESSYLYTNWEGNSLGYVLETVIWDLKNQLLALDEYAGYALLSGLIALILIAIRRLVQPGATGKKISWIILAIGNFFSSSALTIYLARVPDDRARLPVILGTAFLAWYGFDTLWREIRRARLRQIACGMMAAGLLFSAFLQTHRLESLFYTADVCERQQFAFGTELMNRIEAINQGKSKRIVMVGAWYAPLNPVCWPQGLIGMSSFCWDYNPWYPTSATRRSNIYLHAALGLDYNLFPTAEETERAVAMAQEMHVFPAEDSVREDDGLIVVLLSDEWRSLLQKTD